MIPATAGCDAGHACFRLVATGRDPSADPRGGEQTRVSLRTMFRTTSKGSCANFARNLVVPDGAIETPKFNRFTLQE